MRKMIVSKKYVNSRVLLNSMDDIYDSKLGQITKTNWQDYPEIIFENENDEVPERQITQKTGYCIRTGVEIPYNIERPLSNEAWKSWNRFKNFDYPEKYCHKTGRPSKGRTSMKKPVL